MQHTYKPLYHLDNRENVRVWYMEQNGSMYRTHSGILDGKIIISAWKQANAKNVGKSNATTDVSQATAEIEALYQKKLDRKYSLSPDTAQKSNYVQPMLAATLDEKKTFKKKKRWYSQPKFDGIRCVMDSGATSRAGKPFFTVAHLISQIEEVSQKYNITFDGELYNHDYREDFEKLVSLIKKQKLSSLTEEELKEVADVVQFHVYDVIFWDDLDKTYEERLDFLKEIFIEDFSESTNIILTESKLHEDLDLDKARAEHDEQFALGYEGVMFRDPDSIYEFKRSKGLVKFKNFDEGEFILVRMIEGTGNWSGAVKAVEVFLEDGTTSEAGVAGSYKANVDRLRQEKEYIGGETTIKYQGFTKDDKLRFGVVKMFHKGKRDY